MPLEDVEFLLDNSEQDSVLVLVDSATRDKDKYPNASAYSIDFDTPIKNVFGVEILDASIPVSFYNLNKHNNILAYSQVFISYGFVYDDFLTYFAELQNNKTFNLYFEDTRPTEILICNATSEGAAKWDELAQDTSREIDSKTSYIFFKRTLCTLPDLSPFSGSIESVPLNRFGFVHKDQVYTVDPLLLQQDQLNVINSGEFSFLQDMTVVYYSVIRITEGEAEVLAETMTDAVHTYVDLYMSNKYIELQVGNFDSVTFTLFVTNILKIQAGTHPVTSLITKEAPNITRPNDYGDFDVSAKLKIYWNGAWPLIFDMKKSNCLEGLGFPTFANKNDKGYYTLPHYSNRSLFMSKPNAKNDVQELLPPNVINLSSIRYLLMRCPEVEDHILGSFKSEHTSPGFGLLRLGASMDISNLRFDYVSLIKKPFHPIGKLSKLSFRFETKFKDLYDFQGIDHNFLLCIKFYVPKQKHKLTKSLLNPNYKSDYLEYTNNPNSAKVIEPAKRSSSTVVNRSKQPSQPLSSLSSPSLPEVISTPRTITEKPQSGIQVSKSSYYTMMTLSIISVLLLIYIGLKNKHRLLLFKK